MYILRCSSPSRGNGWLKLAFFWLGFFRDLLRKRLSFFIQCLLQSVLKRDRLHRLADEPGDRVDENEQPRNGRSCLCVGPSHEDEEWRQENAADGCGESGEEAEAGANGQGDGARWSVRGGVGSRVEDEAGGRR